MPFLLYPNNTQNLRERKLTSTGKKEGKMAGILIPLVLSLLLSTQMSRDLYTDKTQGVLSLTDTSSCVASNHLL